MGVKIIIHNLVSKGDEVLLLQRSKDCGNLPEYWDIPGGSLEEGEDLREGVIRETREESGIETSRPKLFFYHSNWEESQGMQYITIVFCSEYVSGEVEVNPEEHQDYKWIKREDLIKFGNNNVPPYYKDMVEEYLNE